MRSTAALFPVGWARQVFGRRLKSSTGNRMNTARRVAVIRCVTEGNSINSTVRVTSPRRTARNLQLQTWKTVLNRFRPLLWSNRRAQAHILGNGSLVLLRRIAKPHLAPFRREELNTCRQGQPVFLCLDATTCYRLLGVLNA